MDLQPRNYPHVRNPSFAEETMNFNLPARLMDPFIERTYFEHGAPIGNFRTNGPKRIDEVSLKARVNYFRLNAIKLGQVLFPFPFETDTARGFEVSSHRSGMNARDNPSEMITGVRETRNVSQQVLNISNVGRELIFKAVRAMNFALRTSL